MLDDDDGKREGTIEKTRVEPGRRAGALLCSLRCRFGGHYYPGEPIEIMRVKANLLWESVAGARRMGGGRYRSIYPAFNPP